MSQKTQNPLALMAAGFAGVIGRAACIVKLTPTLAAHWVKTMRFEGQRPIKPATVAKWKRKIRENTFIDSVQFFFAQVGDLLFQLDANHRTNAVAESDRAIYVTMTTLRVKSMAVARALYTAFDLGDPKRSETEMYLSYFGNGILGHCCKTVVAQTLGAMQVIASSFSETYKRVLSGSAMAVLFAANRFMATSAKLAKVIKRNLKGFKKKSTLFNQYGYSVAVVTAQWQRAKAHMYWAVVAGAATEDENHPGLAYRHFLQEEIEGVPARDADGKRMRNVTPAGESRVAAYCWNCYFKNEPLAEGFDFRIPAKAKHIKILGTPFEDEPGTKRYIRRLRNYGIAGASPIKEDVTRSQTNYKPKTEQAETAGKPSKKNKAKSGTVA